MCPASFESPVGASPLHDEIALLLSSFDGRAGFRSLLEEMRHAAISERDFVTALRLRKVMRRRSLFESAYEFAVREAATALFNSPRRNEFGDGEFAKWFLDWLANGGFEAILDFIAGLIGIGIFSAAN